MVKIKVSPHHVKEDLETIEIRMNSGDLLATIIPRDNKLTIVSKYNYKIKEDKTMQLGIPNLIVFDFPESEKKKQQHGFQFIGELKNTTNAGILKSPIVFQDGNLNYKPCNIELLKFWSNFMNYQGRKELSLRIF